VVPAIVVVLVPVVVAIAVDVDGIADVRVAAVGKIVRAIADIRIRAISAEGILASLTETAAASDLAAIQLAGASATQGELRSLSK
jgi:hypothetical protein